MSAGERPKLKCPKVLILSRMWVLAMAMHLPSWSYLKCSRLTFTRTAIHSFDTDRRRDERGNNHPSSKRCGRGAKQTLKRSARTGSARYAAGNRPLVTGNYIQHERIKWLKKKTLGHAVFIKVTQNVYLGLRRILKPDTKIRGKKPHTYTRKLQINILYDYRYKHS